VSTPGPYTSSMIKNEQSSSVMYGVFLCEPYAGSAILGLYATREEAQAAADVYVAAEELPVGVAAHYGFGN
jgi:hypothetical protein